MAWGLVLVSRRGLRALAAASIGAAALARPPLARLAGVGRSALAWVGSARQDMAKEDATGDNPAVLTVKLVALVAGLFGVIVLAIRLFGWASRMLAESFPPV